MLKRMRSFTGALLLVLVISGAAIGQAVPPAPTQRAHRFGAYFWEVDYAGWPGSPDKLTWGSNIIAQTGSHTIRLFLGDPLYSCNSTETGAYGVNPFPNPDDPDYLARIAQTPQFRALFNDPRFSTYILTTYTFGDNILNWADGFSWDEYDYERTRIFRLGAELINNYNKTFIILNWEGDHHFSQYFGARDSFVSWIQSRAEGVAAARNNFPFAPGRIYSGLEFNCVENIGGPCGDPGSGTPIVVDYVAPRVAVDYLSYSSWGSIGGPASGLPAAIQGAVSTIVTKANTRYVPDGIVYGAANVILGEYGFHQQQLGVFTAADKVTAMFGAAESAGVSYAIYWQALHNGCGEPTPNFGLVDAPPGFPMIWNFSGIAFINGIAGY